MSRILFKDGITLTPFEELRNQYILTDNGLIKKIGNNIRAN